MKRTHDGRCRCAPCRHARFRPGYPTSAKAANFYGAFAGWEREGRKRRVESGTLAEDAPPPVSASALALLLRHRWRSALAQLLARSRGNR